MIDRRTILVSTLFAPLAYFLNKQERLRVGDKVKNVSWVDPLGRSWQLSGIITKEANETTKVFMGSMWDKVFPNWRNKRLFYVKTEIGDTLCPEDGLRKVV